MKKSKVYAVVATYTGIDSVHSDLVAWFYKKRDAITKLKDQIARYPGVNFDIVPALAWRDTEYEHWHVKRADV